MDLSLQGGKWAMPTNGAQPEARGGKREVAPEQHVLLNTPSEQQLRLSEPRESLGHTRIPSLRVFDRARDILHEKRTAAANLDAGDIASRQNVQSNVDVDASFGPKSEAEQGPDAETRRLADDTRRRRGRDARAVSRVSCYLEHAEGSTRLHPRGITKKEKEKKAAKEERMGKEQEDKAATPEAKEVWKAEKTAEAAALKEKVRALKEKVRAQRKEAKERAEARQQPAQVRRLASSIKTATVSQKPRRDGNAEEVEEEEEEKEEEREGSLLLKKPAAASPRSQAGVIAGKAAAFIRLKKAELEASRRTLSAAQDNEDAVVTNVWSSVEGVQADAPVEASSHKKHRFSSQLEEEAWAWAQQLSEPALAASQSDARGTSNEATRDVRYVDGEGEGAAEREKKKEEEETRINEMVEAPRNQGVSESDRERERERLSSVALGEAEQAAAAIWQRQAEIEAAQAAAPPPAHAWAHQFEPAPGHNVMYTEDSAAARGGGGKRRERGRRGRVYTEKSRVLRGVEADVMLEASHAATPLPNEKLLLNQLDYLIRTHSKAPFAGNSGQQAAARAGEPPDLVPHASMQEDSPLDAAARARDESREVTAEAKWNEDLYMNARFQALILKRTD